MRYLFPLLLVLMLAFIACEEPASLEAIAGVEGSVNFNTSWPDSIKGAVVVVFDDELALDSVSVVEYPVFDHFITYGDPISAEAGSANYFIQLEPGEYFLMVIGFLLEPAELLTDEEKFQNIQDYIVVPENMSPRGIIVREKIVNEQTGWSVRF